MQMEYAMGWVWTQEAADQAESVTLRDMPRARVEEGVVVLQRVCGARAQTT